MTADEMTAQMAAIQDRLTHAHDRLSAAAHHDAVFGTPIQKGDVIVIPCAETMLALGMGFGMGSDTREGARKGGTGGGGGGGGSASGRPVAVIVIDAKGVRMQPIVDVTKISLAAYAALGAFLFAFARMRRGAKQAKRTVE